MSVFVIAEAGVNHNGSMDTAFELIEAARDAGADAVKFQHFNSHRLWGDARIEHLQLTDGQMETLAARCGKVGIEFMCTPFGVHEVGVLLPLIKRWKVASGCLDKWALLDAVAATGLPVILSTGMSSDQRVGAAIKRLNWTNTAALHCVSAYPCPIEQVNLRAMDKYLPRGGLSDHTQGITVAIAAVGRGAQIIEKHLTLDRNAEGPDHKASIEPDTFRVMVNAIRDVEKALGDGVKRIQPSETATARAWYG